MAVTVPAHAHRERPGVVVRPKASPRSASPRPRALQAGAGGYVRIKPGDYVRIEPGTFMMGSPTNEPGRYGDEAQHKVTLTHAFMMKATEVTRGEWEAVMGSNPSKFSNCGASCPVEQVSWYEAIAYANAVSQKEGAGEVLPGRGQALSQEFCASEEDTELAEGCIVCGIPVAHGGGVGIRGASRDDDGVSH
jgi:hypothetical protein